MNKILSEDLDAHPYTGKVQVKGKLRFKDNEYTRPFFNGTENYSQIKNITPGKVYEVVGKEGHGDVEDIYVIDDANEIQSFCDYFFEEIENVKTATVTQEVEPERE
ncbi:MAG: hypothetical protein IJX17_05550 [Clostridia bacterium]|nr:hypothetical protein [Clostridia bacterium]